MDIPKRYENENYGIISIVVPIVVQKLYLAIVR